MAANHMDLPPHPPRSADDREVRLELKNNLAKVSIERQMPSTAAAVKQIKFLKMDAYKNASQEGGAMATAIKNAVPGHIIWHSQTKKNGRIWGSTTPENLLKLIEINRGIYEVIHNFPHKIYFDIDGDPNLQLDSVKDVILQYFPEADMAISGSITEKRASFHITVQNYHICSEEDRNYMIVLTKHICIEHPSFDTRVYTKNRNMKCINQSKDDGRVQAILENDDHKAHCIN